MLTKGRIFVCWGNVMVISGSVNGLRDDSDSYSLSTSEMNESVLRFMMMVACVHLGSNLNQYANQKDRIAVSYR